MERKQLREDVDKFEKYLESFGCFPKNLNRHLLARFLNTCNFDMERAKELLEYNFRFRQKHPNLFTNRDVHSAEMQEALKNYQSFPMHVFTKEYHHVDVIRLLEADFTKFDLVNALRWLILMSDGCIMSEIKQFATGEIVIVDLSKFSWFHITKILRHIGVLREFLKFSQEASPYRVIQNHMVNCSPVIAKFWSLAKPFIHAHLVESTYFHTSNFETLHACIPKEMLPAEYGGTNRTIDEHNQEALGLVYDASEDLKNEDIWKIHD